MEFCYCTTENIITVMIIQYNWCPKLCSPKVLHVLASWDKAFYSEKNDAKVIEFGWVL